MIRPGVIALVLVMVMAFSLGVQLDRQNSILDQGYSQVTVLVCGDSYGTAWFINHEDVITAYHVVKDCTVKGKPMLVRDPWYSNATIVAFDPELDVAVLKVEYPPNWAHGLKLSPTVAIGDDVYVVGYPVQLYQEVGRDVSEMSRIPRVQKASVTWINPDRQVFEFSPGTDAGNSGGPVISVESGGVVGIVVYARSGVVSEGFYGLRMDGLVQFLDEHNIRYSVVGEHSVLLYTGIGVVALLGLIVVGKREGVRVWR